MSSPAVSHHLKLLNECGLITSRRDGKEVYYRADDTKICQLLHITVEQVIEIACPEKAVDFHASPQEIIHRVHDYLTEHLGSRITIEELSKQFLMNATTLKKTFREVYGNSIAAHITEHRMEEAARLLAETDESMGGIAKKVGYGSQSRFTEMFKETFSVLPTEFRKHPDKDLVLEKCGRHPARE